MKRMIYATLASLLIGTLFCGPVVAKELSCFYSDVSQIGFVPVRSMWVINMDGFDVQEFSGYLNHATAQWAGAGIQTFSIETQHDSATEFWGGTRETLEQLEPRLKDYAALTRYITVISEGTHSYNGQTIYNFRILKTKVYVPKQPWWYLWFDNHYRTAFTHELGHALGWLGHSPNSSDVMHNSPGARPNLTNRDRTHLSQNYN